jgi:hypothetical protein
MTQNRLHPDAAVRLGISPGRCCIVAHAAASTGLPLSAPDDHPASVTPVRVIRRRTPPSPHVLCHRQDISVATPTSLLGAEAVS